MTKTIQNLTENLTHVYGMKPMVFRCLLGLNVAMFLVYFSLLGFAVDNMVKTRENAKVVHVLEQETSSMEREYFSSLDKIDLAYAESLGFVSNGGNVNYVNRRVTIALASR